MPTFRRLTLTVASIALTLVGCGNITSLPARDSGTVKSPDTGTQHTTDSGTPTSPDSGTPDGGELPSASATMLVFTNATPDAHTYGAPNWSTLTNPATASCTEKAVTYKTADVTYSVAATPSGATVSSTGVLTITTPGSYIVTASVAAKSPLCPAQTATYTFTANKATPTLAFNTIGADQTKSRTLRSFSNPAVLTSIKDCVTTGTTGVFCASGAVAYASSRTDVATVDSAGLATFGISSGNVSTDITATYPGDAYYSGASAKYTLHLTDKTVPTVSWSTQPATRVYGSDKWETETNVASAVCPGVEAAYDAGVAYSIDLANGTATSAKVSDGGVVTLNSTDGAGAYIVTAVFGETDACSRVTGTYNLLVDKRPTTVAFATPTRNLPLSDEPTAAFDATVHEEAGCKSCTAPTVASALTYASDHADIAKVLTPAKSILALVAQGTATISVSYLGDVNYLAATGSYALTVGKRTPTLAFASTAARHILLGTTPSAYPATLTTCKNCPATTASVTYRSSNTAVATVNSSTGATTPVSVGSATITASFAGDDNYAATADAQYTLTVAKQPSRAVALDFDWTATRTVLRGTSVETKVATLSVCVTCPATSTRVAYSSATPAVATVDASTGAITLGTDTGSTVITATFPGDANYDSKTATYTLTVAKAVLAQFAFESATRTIQYGDTVGAFAARVSPCTGCAAPTGNVRYAIYPESTVATISATSGDLTLVAAGTARITAEFQGDSNYESKTITYSLTVNKRSLTNDQFKFTEVARSLEVGHDGTQAVTVANSICTNCAPPSGAITYATGGAGHATVNSNTGVVTGVTLGTETITATMAADSRYLAKSASYHVTVTAPASGQGTPPASRPGMPPANRQKPF